MARTTRSVRTLTSASTATRFLAVSRLKTQTNHPRRAMMTMMTGATPRTQKVFISCSPRTASRPSERTRVSPATVAQP